MATYSFATITPAQAAAYSSQTDSLDLNGATGSDLHIRYSGPSTLTVTNFYSGTAKSFGLGLQGEQAAGLRVGTTAADSLSVNSGYSGLFGLDGNDTLTASGGANRLVGGTGADVLDGLGSVTYAFDAGDSGVVDGQLDQIENWSLLQTLIFPSGAGTQQNFAVFGDDVTYAFALQRANTLISAGETTYVVSRVGSDVVVFADSRGDHGQADDAVLIKNIHVGDLGPINFKADPASPTAPPPTEITGTAGPDTLTGHGMIWGLEGNDLITIDDDIPGYAMGGDGVDTVDFSLFTVAVTANLATETGHSVAEGQYYANLLSIENMIGTGGGDTLVGDSVANVLSGVAGADSLAGAGGADTLNGGDGNDTALGEAGDDILNGDGGADSLSGGDGADTLAGGLGADILSGGAGADLFDFNSEALVTDRIVDWSVDDRLRFASGFVATSSSYVETTAASLESAIAATPAGYEYLAVQVGGDVIVYQAAAQAGVVLTGKTLADISTANIIGLPVPTPTPTPTPSATPTAGADMLNAAVSGVVTANGLELDGGAGADTITAVSGKTYLRGGAGSDSVSGGVGFDDINGNQGDDTLSGGLGDDWVVGGQDNDTQSGGEGADIVWGNKGNDTLDGGVGADQVRGGQGDDVINGGAGDDFVSGDMGNDTITGGAGADRFHTWSAAGIDRVLDFNQAEGDRVMFDPGTSFIAAQVGTDVVITMPEGGAQMILVGVQISSLTTGWFYESWV